LEEQVGLIVKSSVELFSDDRTEEPIPKQTRGFVFSIENDIWICIFTTGQALDFNKFERNRFLKILDRKLEGKYKNKIYGKKNNNK